ncbi:hypothetical protein EsDP_00001785 [Epichloe bromicola]|uniref:Enterotoxin n=1 Tax=Epichloe bromicola TaxID=79588 RepID=A0ABQ0CIV0_9HYPO
MKPSQRHVTLFFLSMKLLVFLGLVNGFTLGQPRSKSAHENELGGRNQASSITLHTRQNRDLEIHYRGTNQKPEEALKPKNKVPDNMANNLDRHVRQAYATNYVSASSNRKRAISFATKDLSRGQVAYVYTIKSTPNAVDVVASYKAAGIGLDGKYLAEMEHSYLGGIRQDQIMEVAKITWGKKGPKVGPAKKSSTYNHKYDQFSGGGAQPGLLKPAEGTSFTTEAEKFLNNEANTRVRNSIDKEYALIPKTTPPGPPAEAKPGHPESPKGEKKPAGSADPEGINRPKLEKPANGGNTGGLEPGKPPPHPASNPDMAQDELIKKSDEIAKREFEALSKKFRVETIDGPSGKLRLADLHTKFTARLKSIAPPLPSKVKMGGIAAGGIDLALYVERVYDVFSKNSTALDRAAVVTSIIPFAGCVMKPAAGSMAPEVGVNLCVFADSLMFTPAFPVGIALHQMAHAIDLLLPDWTSYLSLEENQRKRDDLWEIHVDSREQYINSGNFTRAVEATFDIEVAALMYPASVAMGALRAGQDILSNHSLPPSEPPQQGRRGPRSAALDKAIQSELCEALTTRREKLRTDYLAAMNLDNEVQVVTEVYLERWRVNMIIAVVLLSGGNYHQKVNDLKQVGDQLLKSRPESKNSTERYTKALESRVDALLGGKFDKTPCNLAASQASQASQAPSQAPTAPGSGATFPGIATGVYALFNAMAKSYQRV